ncbi:8916_t:CDS:1 [Paraglomus brasilianum]|uniref:8916_t:CDS:1 n=1 Tax=Paraglomus brasilianum TaxID=144538 RepID=A0A9N9H2X1_9GLOM|nr:8916_t:CDS:1 [Paraglomus brasilianum]
MDTPYLKSYYRRGSTFLTSEQIDTIRTLKGKVPKYRIIKDFHINENRVNDIWESHERQQQIIQNTISTEIFLDHSNQIKSEVLLQSNGSSNLHLESTTPLDTETKKRRSKSRTKSVLCNKLLRSHISDSTPTNNPIEKISSEGNRRFDALHDLDALYEKEARRDEKNKANITRLLATT